MDFHEMNLRDVVKLPGIGDIPHLAARAKFAKALRAESKAGYTTEEAMQYLEEAIDEEQRGIS